MTTKQITQTQDWLKKAEQLFPGGVNSPVRAFRAVEGDPFFVKEARGSRLITEEGVSLIDYVQSWGALILGHAHPAVVEAIQIQASKGTSYGTSHKLEVELAERIQQFFPSIEKMRFSNSGTEAVMSAIRLARGATGRDKILKFEGNYHGHADSLLVKAGSGAATFGVPDSAGIPADLAQHTLTLPYNDLPALEELFVQSGKEIACVIIEPVAGNMGVVPAEKNFLKKLRVLTQEHGALLFFDEVMSGFRVSRGGAQELYGIVPDLTALGKVIGGGLPVSAFGGKADVMDQLAPLGPVYQAGTLAGNPLAMAAGIATLDQIDQPGFYEALEKKSHRLESGLSNVLKELNINFQVQRVGAMFTLFFSEMPVQSFADAKNSNLKQFARFFQSMLQEGVFLPPSQFEAWFVSSAHTVEDIDVTLNAVKKSLQKS